MQRISDYSESLPNGAKVQKWMLLVELTGNIGGLDEFLSNIEASDLVSYLVMQTSFITAK